MGRCMENMDSASYMRHLKGESLHVCSFMRRRTEKMRKWAGFSFIHETPMYVHLWGDARKIWIQLHT